jgi:DnaJ-class molecular chaperone
MTKQLPDVCPECYGDGQINYCPSDGDKCSGCESDPCPTCHGTGLMPTQAQIQHEAFEEQQAERSSYERHLGL